MEKGNYNSVTCTPFSNFVITKNLDKFLQRVVSKNLASVFIIDGGLGLGKTTTAVQMASYMQGAPIDFELQLALGGTQLMDKLLRCQKKNKRVLIYDEASDFNRRGALTKFNAELNRVFDVCRAFKIIIIMVLPSVKVLDNDLFNKGIVRGLFHVADKSINYNLVWAYSTYRTAYLIRNLKDTKQYPVPGKCYLKTYHNFDFRTYNLCPAREKELEKYSTESKLNVLSNTVRKAKGVLSQRQMAQMLGVSDSWISNKIKVLKIKCHMKADRQNYYTAVVLEELRAHIKRVPRMDQGRKARDGMNH